MARDVKLPQLGQTMEEGTIVTSLVKVGDKVSKGSVIFEIETDKATLEMESPAEGYVKKILIEVGETVSINTPVLILGDKDEEITAEYLASLGVAADKGPGAPAETEVETPVEKATSPKATAGGATVPADGAVTAPDGVKVVRLPQLGQTMEEGTIVTSLIKQGDTVAKGSVIFEIETDKATLEMESPAEGVVKKILVGVGETIPINTPILVLAAKGVEVSQAYVDSLGGGAASAAAPVSKQAAVVEERYHAPAMAAATGGRVFASPRARTVAAEMGVDLSRVAPAAGAARITEADVRKAAASGTAVGAGATVHSLGQKIKLNRLQKIVGQRMLESKREIPCFYLNVKVDMTELVKLRTKMNKSGEVKVSFNDFIIKAVGLGLERYPIMTGQLDGEYIQLAGQIDIGLAISTDDGLVAPMVKDVAGKDIRQVASYSKALVERAKGGSLSLDDLAGGCITVSNLGGFGIDSFIPIVVPGQCSILGVGRINDTCVPVDGNIMVRKMMNLNLSVNHKVANGADAAQFLDYVKKMLENAATFE